MRPRARLFCAPLVVGLCGASGCGGDAAFGMGAAEGDWSSEDVAPTSDAGGGQGAGRDAAAEGSEPEQPEVGERVEPLPASLSYVFALNTSENAIARIDPSTLAVRPIPVGRTPTAIRAVSSTDTVVVLNAGSDTVSIVAADGAEPRVTSVPIIEAANAIALSRSGAFAVAWYDHPRARPGDRVGSLQEVAVVSVAEAAAWVVTVGFGVRQVQLVEDHLFVTTRDGLSHADLTQLDGDRVAAQIALDDVGDAQDREVVLADSGAVAVARTLGAAELSVVDVSAGTRSFVTLPAAATDIDLSADGETVYASMRGVGQIAVIDVARIEAASGWPVIEVGDTVGSLALTANPERGIAYSTVAGVAALSEVDLSARTARRISLPGAPAAVWTTPQDGRVLVLHEPGAYADETVVTAALGAGYALSTVDLASGFAKVERLDAAPLQVVTTPDGHDAFVLPDPAATGLKRVAWIDLDTLVGRTVTLTAEPESLGVTPAGLAFVAQRAAGGRLTFIDPDSGAQRHVSAFQLNGYLD